MTGQRTNVEIEQRLVALGYPSALAWLHPSLVDDFEALVREQDELGPLPAGWNETEKLSDKQQKILAAFWDLNFMSHELYAGRSLYADDLQQRYDAFMEAFHRRR